MTPLCIVCSNRVDTFLPEVKDHLFGIEGSFSIVRCLSKECGHGQLEPLPTSAELITYYSRYITHEDANPDDNPRQDPVSRYLKSRPGHEARKYLFLNDRKAGRVLEIGSGNGINLLNLRGLGWDVSGQEPDPIASEGARARGLSISTGFLADVESRLGTYDAIIMIHVIEHLRDPRVELQLSRSHLSKGGRLVIITPNIESLPRRIFGRFWAPLHVPFHLQHFTLSSLESVVGLAGYSILQSFTHSTHSASNIRASLGFAAKEKAWLRSLLEVPMLSKAIEAAMFFGLLFVGSFARRSGDECVIIAESAT